MFNKSCGLGLPTKCPKPLMVSCLRLPILHIAHELPAAQVVSITSTELPVAFPVRIKAVIPCTLHQDLHVDVFDGEDEKRDCHRGCVVCRTANTNCRMCLFVHLVPSLLLSAF